MNSIHSRQSSVNLSRTRRALVQPRFLLAMTAMASAVGGVSFLATAQTGRAPVKMQASSGSGHSKPANLMDLPSLVKRAGASGKLATKAAAKKSGRTAQSSRTTQAVVSGRNVSGFNLNDVDLTPNSPSDEREPLFSPSGDLIVFRSNGADSNGDSAIDSLNANRKFHVWVMNSDGSDQRQLTGLAGNGDAARNQFRPSWSPDGNQVVYIDEKVPDLTSSSNAAADQLFVVSTLEGSDTTPQQRTFFAGDKKSPAWAPNGLTITFACKSDPTTGANLGQFDLFSIDPGGDASTAQRLTGGDNDPGGNTADDLNPAYSPGRGNTLYFSSNRNNNGPSTGRRIWRLNGATPQLVTDPSQRAGFNAADTISDDFPTLSLEKDFSTFGGSVTNNANRNVTEQLAFQTNSPLNANDANLDLNIWGIPTSALPEASGAAFVITNGSSSSETAQSGVTNGGEDFAPDQEPAFGRSILSPQRIGALAFASQRISNPNPGATNQNPTGGNGLNSTNDIYVTGTVDTTPPILVPQSVGNQAFPVVSPLATLAGQGQGNPRTFEAGLRPGAAPGTPGSLKLAVVIDERESGLDRNSSIVAVIRDANQVQVNEGTSPVNEEVKVTLAQEIGYAQTNTYALTAVDDGVNEKQAGAVAGDGIYYCSTDVQTPTSGEYYIDIVATDQKQNTFTYDNIWGFSTRPFTKSRQDLLVSDYAVGQLFPNNLSGDTSSFFDNGGDDGRFVNMFPVESYLINAQGGIATPPKNDFNSQGQSTVNAFPTADVWRILCRGPVTSALLNTYRPGIVSQIDPNETVAEDGKPFTAKTRKVAVASASVTWASPYTGEVFAGPGTLVDASTQDVLTEFSNSGGRLFVMGRDVGFGLTSGGTVGSDFLNTVLGADWGGDVPTGNGGRRDPGVLIKNEAGGFIKRTLSYGVFLTPALQDLQVPYHYENKDFDKLTDTWLDAALNLNPNTSLNTTSDGSGSTFFRQAVGVQPDEFIPTNAAGAVTEKSYSVGGRTIGQRLSRKIDTVESRSVVFGFGLESINRRYRKPDKDFRTIALDARAQVVRGVNSYLKTGSISGTVINASTNRPIPDFLVRITRETDNTVVYLARTDKNGTYSVAGLSETSDNGGYRVEPAFIDANGKLLPIGGKTGQTSPSGFFGGSTRNTVEIVGGSNTPNVNLRPIPIIPGSLRGKVVTLDLNGKEIPANGLYVLVRSKTESSVFPGGGQYASVVKTNFAGEFRFSGVPALTDLEVILNPSIADIPEKSGLRASFTPPVFSGTFQNGSLGRRLINGLSRPDASTTSALQVPSGGTFVLNDSNPDTTADSGVPLLLKPFLATLSGRVTVNKVAAVNVLVQLLSENGSPITPARATRTDTSGNYVLANVGAGRFIIKATTPLGSTASSKVFIVENKSNTVNITVPTINITTRILSGLVKLRTVGVTAADKNLANATVELLNASGAAFSPAVTTVTKSDGKYSFGVAPGSYKVRATYTVARTTLTSGVSATVKVVGTSGTATGPNLFITTYLVSGRVVSSAGAGQARATVELVSGTNTLQSITADSGGNFKFLNVSPGSYVVKAFSSSGATGQTTVALKSGAQSVPAIKVIVSGTGGPGPTGPTEPTDPGNGNGTDGGGSTGQTFAANTTFQVSLPYATDNKLGTVRVDQAFNGPLSQFNLFRFNAARQVNNLNRDLVKITSGSFLLKRGEGYVLQTLDTEVTTRTPVDTSSLKSFAGTTFTIPLTWNNTYLSDTSAPDNRNNGYNLIGFPFNPSKYNRVSFLKARVMYGSKTYNSVDEAAAAGIISNRLFALDAQGVRNPIADTDLQPFVGYFVRILRNDQPIKLVLINPTSSSN
ncbi:WD40-like Beta Propeller Repeat [Abditibacterium utsteinense]|uniref:WD40-like Beta Propeller Repeat n=1 Tax=Abditibacterium utsteinense TaxID=1960156 RepID=A0A2S8SUX6_9BACT|nr:carboxypeptidase regulatory-like domain-containing protein [Abditibacterium utsteinense]PQV64593.1 WD40-like Beta Propeller Repeat [Abditibacterium utsteinense]